MPRPRLPRRIAFQPDVTYFKPAGIPLRNLQESILTFDELESIRLIDKEKLSQSKAAKKMKISQATLSRLLTSAREKLANAIINGNSIKIQGGNFKMAIPRGRGQGLGRGSEGRGRMQGNKPGSGPGGQCI
ncbi:MAG: DUF134 domain-containing protein, partial [Candidatus Nanoarchaeia archaeon]